MVSSDKIDRRIARRRQLPPVNLKDLVRDPHRVPCHDYPCFSMPSSSA
jgi:hypothetical protein